MIPSDELAAPGCVFTPSACEIDVMLRLFPGSRELGTDPAVFRDDDDRVRREKRRNRDALGFFTINCKLPVYRKNQREIGVACRALTYEIEMPELRNFVAPELEPHRLRHSETVDIEDSAAHAELRDVIDHLHTLEPDRLEVSCESFGPMSVAFANLKSRVRKRARQLGLLENRSRGGEQNLDLAATNSLERFNALAGNFSVRLCFAEAFARGIESDESGVAKRLEVSQPSLGT
jgi:hypothetical protein